jgi:hypothetical protein
VGRQAISRFDGSPLYTIYQYGEEEIEEFEVGRGKETYQSLVVEKYLTGAL